MSHMRCLQFPLPSLCLTKAFDKCVECFINHMRSCIVTLKDRYVAIICSVGSNQLNNLWKYMVTNECRKRKLWIVGYSFIQTIHVTINQISITSHPDNFTIVSMTPIFIKPTFLDVWLCNSSSLHTI